MHHIKTHVAGAYDAHQSVEVGTVVIKQRAVGMDGIGNFHDLIFKQAQRGWVGQH
jgi:hypothetical protein